MKPSLLNEPYASRFSDILRCFENGKPLSSEQIHFLARYEKLLSSYKLDPVLRYYLKSQHYLAKKLPAITFSDTRFTHLSVQHIKQQVTQVLKENLSHVDLKMTPEQFAQFRLLSIHELIFWHGNQFLTGAPFYPGGIPHVIYFQWGNLFGIVKMNVLSEERALRGNILIYFEDMHDRSLYACVKEYAHKEREELKLEESLIQQQQEEFILTDQPQYSSPRPGASPVIVEIEDEK